MELGAIAFMLGKSVLGMARVHFHHDSVAGHLGNDTGRGDAETQGVATDQGGLDNRERMDGQAVNEDVVRNGSQRGDSAAHGLVRGAQDIDPVDLFHFNRGDRPLHPGVGHEIGVDPFALQLRELLGVVERFVPKTFRQNNRCGDDGTGEWAATRFINPCDEDEAAGAQGALVLESAGHGRRLEAYAAVLDAFSRTAMAALPVRLRR